MNSYFADTTALMLQVAKLHIMLGALASSAGRGKLYLAAHAKAHALMQQGRVPHAYEQLAKYLIEYENPVSKLQDDFSKAKLRVADTLLPLGMQIIRFSDVSYVRSESVLYPLAEPKGGKTGPTELPAVDPLLARLPEARQWLIYGLLLYPDDLAEAGAIDVLIGLLNNTYVLPVFGTDVLFPHAEFEADSKTLLKWIKRKEDVKRFSVHDQRFKIVGVS